MKINNIGKVRISIILLLLLLVIAAAYTGSKQLNTDSGKDAASLIKKKQYVCSMHPQVVRDKPGDCPICGMSLIEKVDDKSSSDSSLNDVVRSVNESVLESLKTVSPLQANLPMVIDALGIINYDSRRIQTVSAHFAGLVERSYVKYQFQPVHKGQKIYQIYCPEIYTEKWEYVKLVQMYPDQDNLTVEAREWLHLLGLTPRQIESLKRNAKPDYHLTVYSPAEGYAVSADFDPDTYFSKGSSEENQSGVSKRTGIGFNEGLTIEKGTPLFKVIDIKSLRADLKVSTQDAGLLRRGQKVIFSFSDSPGKKIVATVNQIEPLNGGLFQLVKVFFKDKSGLFIPGRQIKAQIFAGKRNSLWIPGTAVVNLGNRQSVFVMLDNKFKAITVKTGVRSGDKVEILSGIDQNSKIALNALLLTDSDGFISTSSR